MLVVMSSHATQEQIDQVLAAIRRMNLTPHPMPGATRTAIGITGNVTAIDARSLEVLPGVEELIRVTKPYKLASREMHEADTYVQIPHTKTTIGPGTFTMIAGPCSVENEEMILRTAEFLRGRGVNLMRAGAFKPRTSPYAFQGMGLEGLEILAKARKKTGIGIVTELMDTDNADAVEEAADIIQIGTRNMQNFSLLKRVGAGPQAGAAQAGHGRHAGGMADGRRVRDGRRQLRSHPLRARRAHVFRPQPQHARSVGRFRRPRRCRICRSWSTPATARASATTCPPWPWPPWPPAPTDCSSKSTPNRTERMSDGAQSLDFAGFDRLLASLRKLAEPLERTIN